MSVGLRRAELLRERGRHEEAIAVLMGHLALEPTLPLRRAELPLGATSRLMEHRQRRVISGHPVRAAMQRGGQCPERNYGRRYRVPLTSTYLEAWSGCP